METRRCRVRLDWGETASEPWPHIVALFNDKLFRGGIYLSPLTRLLSPSLTLSPIVGVSDDATIVLFRQSTIHCSGMIITNCWFHIKPIEMNFLIHIWIYCAILNSIAITTFFIFMHSFKRKTGFVTIRHFEIWYINFSKIQNEQETFGSFHPQKLDLRQK